MTSSERQQLKERVIALRGYWHDFHEGLLEHDPDFLAAYVDFVSRPWLTGHLPGKTREFIYIAVDASAAHMYERGMRRHMEFAVEQGATIGELLEVVQIATSLGGESAIMGVELLCEELAEAGRAPEMPAGDSHRRLKEDVSDRLGGWPPYADAFLKLDPDYLRIHAAFAGKKADNRHLDAKTREFISIAVNLSPATLNRDAVRRGMRAALAHGATEGELLEVIQLASAISIHSCTIGVPNAVAAARGAGKGAA